MTNTTLKPYKHQEIAARFINEKKYVLIGDEMGLGKTFEAIVALVSSIGPKVVVVPAMLRQTWKDEILKWFPFETIEVVNSSKHTYKIADWYIISYSMLKHCEVIPIAVVFDECHYIKNLRAARTQQAHAFVLENKPEHCVCLSGTPIKNNATEFYSVLKLLSYCPSNTNGKKITEKSQYAFNLRYSHPRTQTIYGPNGPMDITKFEGIRNLERLKGFLKGKYLRRLTKSVVELPEIIDKDVVISAKKDKKLLEAFEEYEAGAKDSHVMTMKANNALMKVGATVEYCLDIITEHLEPVVIFTDHVEPCKEIAKALVAKNVRVGIIHGGTNTDERARLVAGFQDGKLDALVCTIGAASTGFTLTRARNLVFNDLSWSYTDIAQARKRIHRIGQKQTCVVHYILVSDADKWIKKKILAKETILKEVL